MTIETAATQGKKDFKTDGSAVKGNFREYGLVLALILIMIFFQFTTNGTLFRPVNLTNLVLQNSYICLLYTSDAADE